MSPISLNVTGIENLTKLIDSLSSKANYYTFLVWTDLEQAYVDSNKRGYTVEIACKDNEEHFVFTSYSEENE